MTNKSHNCDWCSKDAKYVTEVKKPSRSYMKPTGLMWYSCENHKRQLEAIGDIVRL
jgi:hypothetical protein